MNDSDPGLPQVWLNGVPRSLPGGGVSAPLDDLVASLGPTPAAVALNDAVVPRSSWAHTRVRPGDRVEAVTAVAGG